jgi:hypothetical protein
VASQKVFPQLKDMLLAAAALLMADQCCRCFVVVKGKYMAQAH